MQESPVPLKRREARDDSQGMICNPFTVLQNVEDNRLVSIASECMLVLGESTEEIDAIVSFIKAKEVAQQPWLRQRRQSKFK